MAPRVRFPNIRGGVVTTWGSLCIGNKTSGPLAMYGTANTESDFDTIQGLPLGNQLGIRICRQQIATATSPEKECLS
jgi:hypothetical protein